MKKLVLVAAMLLAVFSGVTAVSAYEGHMVDVKAHVENALMVEKSEVDFGTVFPQEKIETQFAVGLSESFRAQTRYSTVEYKMYWEPKLIAGHQGALDPNGDGKFEAIWPFIAVKVNSVDYPISAYVQNANGTILIGDGDLDIEGNPCDSIHLKLDPPVFDKWYNALTDPRLPSGILTNGVEGTADDQYVVETEEAACGFEAEVPHTDLGNNFKIQVVNIVVDA